MKLSTPSSALHSVWDSALSMAATTTSVPINCRCALVQAVLQVDLSETKLNLTVFRKNTLVDG